MAPGPTMAIVGISEPIKSRRAPPVVRRALAPAPPSRPPCADDSRAPPRRGWRRYCRSSRDRRWYARHGVRDETRAPTDAGAPPRDRAAHAPDARAHRAHRANVRVRAHCTSRLDTESVGGYVPPPPVHEWLPIAPP